MSTELERTASLYRLLFQLPTMKKLLIFSVTSSLIVGVTIRLIAYFSLYPINNLIMGIIQGSVILFTPIVLSTLIVRLLLKSNDLVWNTRRLFALSFLCMLFLSAAYLVGAIISSLTNQIILLYIAFILGASLIFMIRLLVFRVMAEFSIPKLLAAAISQPLLCVGAFLLFDLFTPLPRITETVIMFTITLAVSGTAVALYLWLVNRPLLKALGVGGLRFFYGFLLDWIENEPRVLEESFEKIGETTSLPVLTLLFKHSNALSSVLVVPNIHPGPFKNVGGSEMPHIIAKHITEKTGAITSVAHGPSTHGQNPVSSKEIKKVIQAVENSLKQSNFTSRASQFVRYTKDEVKVSCQIFGNLALLTATLSPTSFDDISPTLGEQIIEAAKSEGVEDAFLIDAHNCGGEVVTPILPNTETAKKMIHAAKMAVRNAITKTSTQIKMSAAQSNLKTLGKPEGIGPAGITVYVIDIAGQKTAYIIIDGNNMVPGLREKIIDEIKKTGVQEAEVMTSDTHTVNAVSLNPRGYNAVGQVGNQEELVTTIAKMAKEATANLQPVKTAHTIKNAEKIKIVGEKQMNLLTSQIVKSVSTAKKSLLLIILAMLLNTLVPLLLFVS